MIILLQVLLMAIPLIIYIFEDNKNKKYGHRLNGVEVVRRIFSYGSLLLMVYSLIGSIFLLFFFFFNVSLKHFMWLIISLIILYVSKKFYDENKL